MDNGKKDGNCKFGAILGHGWNSMLNYFRKYDHGFKCTIERNDMGYEYDNQTHSFKGRVVSVISGVRYMSLHHKI